MNATMANYKVPSEEGRVVTKENTIGLPPGFRFHPTDEEIVVHYLIPKVMNSEFSAAPIGQAHFNKCEPWDLPEIGNMGNTEERYYFFQRDKKYSTGLRTNRATKAGYWKATGKDVEIYISSGDRRDPIGMKKTLVFYMGRAPRGGKTNWIMHEYRLLHQLTLIPKNDGWVVSRVLHKNAGDGDGDGMQKKPYSGKDSSFSLNLGSNGSLSTDNLIKDDDFDSLPPLIDPSAAPDDAPQFQDLKPKPVVLISEGLLHKAINMPAKMWSPSSSIFDACDEDQLIYAHDPSYYYPTFSETLLQKPDPLGFEQPMAENNVVGSVMENYNCKFEQHFASSAGIGFSHASQISSSAMTNNNNKNLEMAANDQETNELLPSTKGLSNLWDY